MAKSATSTSKSKARPKAKPRTKRTTKSKIQTKAGTAQRAKSGTGRAQSGAGAADAFVSLLQSPLVADLVAVAATAALAALAEHGFSSRSSGGQKTAGKAVKEAGKAAAAAVGRRLSNEMDSIREAAKAKKRA